jgi:FtsP/CotA-like multicopper oxidase with cupredoxin domain
MDARSSWDRGDLGGRFGLRGAATLNGSIVSPWAGLDFRGVGGFGFVVAFALGLLIQVACADQLIQPPVCPPLKPKSPDELIQPPVCSLKCIPSELKDYCKIEKLGTEHHKITVNLKAQFSPIKVGEYIVTTEHYNDSYLTPVIEALPGDTVAAKLANGLPDLPPIYCAHTIANIAACVNPTNLHYFHGGIVTPRNARSEVKDARDGTGDNIYVWRKNGADSKPFDFDVPIPGKGELDARALEGEGFISHPNGLNWYHSHLHGISSAQVMGGMSGLLSVGEDNANVKAKCEKYPPDDKCNKDTDELKKRTIVKYALLRDISLKLPEDANDKTAEWDRDKVDFESDDKCLAWKTKNSPPEPVPETLRKGFCQRDQNSAWLFTLNGQRFPTITVKGGQNLLLRLGNLSPNVAYWLELVQVNETTRKPIPLTILSLDGVVPAKPVDTAFAKIPVDAVAADDLLLMPASRAELYVRNDLEEGHPTKQSYILRTKGLNAGSDHWPAIELATIDLEPSPPARGIALALNVPVEQFPIKPQALPTPAQMPRGCVRDLNGGEHRRVTFRQAISPGGADHQAAFRITTEIVKPPPPRDDGRSNFEEVDFIPDIGATVDASFEEYEIPGGDGSIDWEGKDGPNHGPNHVCIHLDHEQSHKQLWVLKNDTAVLHNFHIHQMKFRLATLDELFAHHIIPSSRSHTCVPSPPGAECKNPDYKLYDPSPNPKTIWHDTIPVPNNKLVFLIMSFDAEQQLGRFVYHCHILKHEDKGLMAPIEVWGP